MADARFPPDGKITFFWGEEQPEMADSWQPVLRHKPPATIEQHPVPGDHRTSVTIGIAELAHAMSQSVDRLATRDVDASTDDDATRRGSSPSTYAGATKGPDGSTNASASNRPASSAATTSPRAPMRSS